MCLVMSASLGPWLSMDSEAVQAGVFRVTPVGQHTHLDNLESLVILLLKTDQTNRKCLLTPVKRFVYSDNATYLYREDL